MLGEYDLGAVVRSLAKPGTLPTKAKSIVFRLIIEYSSLRDFGP